MNIIPKDLTIHTMLLNPTEQLVIPSYQRRYAWKDAQVYALFEDIDMLQDNDGHLFGMLILHTGAHHGGINQIDVVDGQQRLTTLSILLHVIRNKYQTFGNNYKVSQIDTMLKCGINEDSKENKLILGELDYGDYQKILKNKLDNIFNKNLVNAYEVFTTLIDERIEEDEPTWLDGFYQKLVHTAKIIRLDVQQAKDAYKLFETINNRGLRLSATDILKNFILGHAAKIGTSKLKEAKYLWSQIIINLDGIPTDDFFRQYISSIYTRKITKSKLIEEFKNHYFKNVKDVEKLGEFTYNQGYYEEPEIEEEEEENEDISLKEISTSNSIDRIDLELFLENIVAASKCYSKIWNVNFEDSKINDKIRSLAHIKSFPTYIFLMHYLQWGNNIKDTHFILDAITTTILRRHICSRRTSENDNIFARLLRIPRQNDYNKLIVKALSEDCPEDDEFIDRFPLHDLKGNLINRAKYILTQIEYYKTGDTGEFIINSGNDVHLEHIIPQKIKPANWKNKYGDWESYLGEKSVLKHRKFVNRIGNMTLLAGDLNISASNNPFTKKKACYRKSNISMTRELGESNKEFKFHRVDSRGIVLAHIAAKIWKL